MKKLSDYTPAYNYCGVCGRVPQNDLEECNWAPIRWWDCDDGWKVGTLCRWCYDEVINDRPHPDDYAYHTTNMVADDINTDLDIIDLFQSVNRPQLETMAYFAACRGDYTNFAQSLLLGVSHSHLRKQKQYWNSRASTHAIFILPTYSALAFDSPLMYLHYITNQHTNQQYYGTIYNLI